MRRSIAIAFAVAPLAAAFPAIAADKASGDCDRRCMSVALDMFLFAMMQHQPAEARLSADYRGTENQHEVAPGEGLWASAEGFGPFQRRFFDTDSKQAAFYGVVAEASEPALLSIRIKFDGSEIQESEAIIAREGEPLYNISGAIADQPRVLPLSPKKQAGRAKLVKTADAYFNGLRDNTGEHIPKIDGCERVENGTRVTHRQRLGGAQGDEAESGDCTAGFEHMQAIADVAYRRFPVADAEQGVVLGVGLFHRPPGAVWRDGSPRKRNLIHEYFVTENGRISEIFAVMRYIEADEPDGTGWE